MKDTNTKKRLYLVKFGDSSTYRYVYVDSVNNDTIWNHPHPLENVEEELKEYLAEKFPEDNALAYYFTPRLEEISWEHESEYASYPEFNKSALEAVKKELVTEIERDQALRLLNNNAPQANAPV